MIRTRALASAAAMVTYWVLSPVGVQAAPMQNVSVNILHKPAENPVCRPLAADLQHWVTVLRHQQTPALGEAALIATDDYVQGPRTPHLNRWIFEAGGAFYGLGHGAASGPFLRQALTHIAGLCPSLPASAADGPLPR